MTTLSIVLGILTWCLISVLIGLVGSRRKIGFAWTFVLSLILIGVFFGWMTFAGPSGFKQKKRSQEFQKTTQKMKVVKRGHKCAVCGRTDKDSPGMEFRYCSKCEGNYEYCMDHLYTHKHVKKEDADNSNSND